MHIAPCRTVFIEKLRVPERVKKFPASCGTQWFITVCTTTRHLSPSWASSIQFTPSNPIFLRWVSLLPSHLRSGLRIYLFPLGLSSCVPHLPPVSRFLVRSDVNCTTAQHNCIRTEQSAFEKFCREALLCYASCRPHSTPYKFWIRRIFKKSHQF